MNQQKVGAESSDSGDTGFSAAGAKSHEAAAQLKNKVVGQVEGARQRAESAKAETADRIRRVATQLRSVGDTLRADDSVAASLAERASDGIEGVARYVSSTDARGFVRDAEQVARRQPALFFGGAFLLGLAAGRFLKSSSGGDVSQPGLNAPRGRARPESALEAEDERGASAGSQRKSEPVPRRPGNPRFQASYDATFGREEGGREEIGREQELPRDASATTGAGVSLPRSPNGQEKSASAGVERGKGITP